VERDDASRPKPDLEMSSMYELVFVLSAVMLLGLSTQVAAQGVSRQEVAGFLRDDQKSRLHKLAATDNLKPSPRTFSIK
jgi:hypothetical protein